MTVFCANSFLYFLKVLFGYLFWLSVSVSCDRCRLQAALLRRLRSPMALKGSSSAGSVPIWAVADAASERTTYHVDVVVGGVWSAARIGPGNIYFPPVIS